MMKIQIFDLMMENTNSDVPSIARQRMWLQNFISISRELNLLLELLKCVVKIPQSNDIPLRNRTYILATCSCIL